MLSFYLDDFAHLHGSRAAMRGKLPELLGGVSTEPAQASAGQHGAAHPLSAAERADMMRAADATGQGLGAVQHA